MNKDKTNQNPKREMPVSKSDTITFDLASSIINNTSDAIIGTNLKGEITLWNKGAVNLYGYTTKEALGKNISIVYREEDLSGLGQRIQKVVQGENISNAEVTIIDKFKNEHSVLLSINGLKNEKGKIDQLVGFSKDITELKLAEQTLKESEHSFSQAFDNSPIPISILNLKTGKRLAVNNTFCKTFGYSREELVNEENFKKNNIAVDQKVFKSIVKIILSEGTVFEHPFSMYTKSGEIRETLVNSTRVYPDNNDIYILSFLDVTDSKIVENALLSSEKKFKNLSESAQVAIAILSEPPEGRFLYVNPYWENLTGYSSKEAEKLKAKDLVAPEFHKVLTKETINRLSMGKASDKTEFRLITKSGEVKWIKFTATMIDFDGENAILRTGLDITAQKNAEHELLLAKENAERSENYLDNIINNIGEPIFVKDEKSKFYMVSNSFCKFLGLTRKEIIGKTLAEDIAPEEQKIFLKIDRQVLKTGQENINEETLTIRGGVTKTIVTRKTRYIDNNGKKYLIGAISDITDRKIAELELKKAQELAHLGSWYLDISTGEVSWSDELFKMYGFDPELPIPPLSEHEEFLSPESWDLLNSSIEHTSNTGNPYSIELETNKKRGINQWKWIFAQGEAVLDSENKIIAIRGTAQDITDRKITEEKIKESEEKYRTLFEQSLIGIGMARGNEVVFANKALIKIFKYNSLEEFMKIPLTEHYSPEDRKILQKRIKEGIANKGKNLPSEYQSDIICKDGEIRTIRGHTTYMNIGDEIYAQTVLMDVTEEVKHGKELMLAKNTLEESKLKFEILSNVTFEGILIHDNGVPIDFNNSFPKMFGYNKDEFLNKDLIKLIIRKDYHSLVLENIKNAYELPYEVIGIKKDGTEFSLEIEGKTYISKENKKLRVTAIRDITDRKKAEEDRLETLSRLNLAIKTAKLGVWSRDAETDELMWNDRLFEIYGSSPDEFESNMDSYFDRLHPDDLDYINEVLGLLYEGDPLHDVKFRIIRPDNEIRYIDSSAAPLVVNGRIEKYIGINRDITEQKLAEDKLRQANLELIDAVSSLNELKKQLVDQNIYLKKELDLVFNFEEMVYGSALFSNVLTDLEKVAPTDATVLILGESGTGKELLARALHNLSLRKDKPLIKVNCSAIPFELIESELFGHKKGSFTGAVSDKIGKFELAEGGTLFLDEIGDLPLAMQPKLLRFLQEGELEVVGGTTTKSLDVRIVAATNKDLKEEVNKQQFREDLYFRLNVFPIEVPPLRKRREDIPLLVEHFSNKFAKKYRKNVKYISDSAMQDMRTHRWPGNIRELENLIERSVILSDSETLNLQGFGSEISKKNKINASTQLTLNDVQRNHILSVLEKTNWKVDGPDGAAQILDIKPSTFRDKMKKLGIKRPD